MTIIERLGLDKIKSALPLSAAQNQTKATLGYKWGWLDSYDSIKRIAGELLVTSIDREGTWYGFDFEIIKK